MEEEKQQNISATDTIKVVKGSKLISSILTWKPLIIGIILGLLFLLFMALLGMFMGGGSVGGGSVVVQNSNLSETTLQWLDEVTAEAQKQEVPELIPYVMAIIEVETKGAGTPDIMQSSESAGLGPNGFDDPKDSIKQGIWYLKNGMLLGENLGFTDVWGVIQGYNFGLNYITYLGSNGGNHSTKIAERYSRDVVAPSLGNNNGATYPYINPVSQAYGQTYLYSNGGNYYYADLVRQYVSAGSAELPVGSDTFKTIMNEALKYEGNAYVWAGYTPTTGFDCSGLMQWVFAKAGISLPRTAVEQHAATEKISINEAQPGDLIFFKGTYGAPDHISHVGIYIDETRMYDANGSGVGYHYWTSSYWMSHFDSIHRVVQ